MSKLFESSVINGMALSNRFVRSATWEGMAGDDGSSTPKLIDLMVKLARGGVGLIVTGHAYVSPEGMASPRQLGIHDDALIPGHGKMVDAVHEAGGKIVMQIAHAGCHALVDVTGIPAVGPSPLEGKSSPLCRAMAQHEIDAVVEAFGRSAERAGDAGFDGVQVHAAHGYLISQFLSPFYNTRTDEYGGNLENRARFLLAVVESIRNAVGTGYPLLVKLNAQDYVEGGFSEDEMVQVALMLQEAGADALELSGGITYSGKFSPVRRGKLDSENQECYYLDAARKYRERVSMPLILVGGIRSRAVAERLVEEGHADFVAMSRPFIREPGLINRWKSEDRAKSECKCDNLCFKPAVAGEGLFCLTEKKYGKK